jgi:hypothetical protein
MAAKKTTRKTKGLKKAKKLAPTKPLAVLMKIVDKA